MKTIHNLDGIYFRVKRDNKYESICFTDLDIDEMKEVLENKDLNWVKGLVNILIKHYNDLCEFLEIPINDFEVADDKGVEYYKYTSYIIGNVIYILGLEHGIIGDINNGEETKR